MFNQVTLIGRLCKDPDIRATGNGDSVANFTLAVDRAYRGADGKKPVDFITITAWRKLAELVQKYLHKGDMCLVSGSIQVQKYQAQDGTNREKYQVVADNVRFFPLKKREGEAEESREVGDDGLPF